MTGAFHQAYDPVAGSVPLSALVAALPLLVLALLLAVARVAPWKAAVAGAGTAAALAGLVWRMPAVLVASAATHGMAFGLWPISWVCLNAVFFYNLTVASGDFDVVRRALARLTEDRRIQALLVAFCFGALVEGIAGFGAPVAISASMLAGLGFEPVSAAVLALVANTSPVAFGSIGIPVVTLGGLLAPILGRDVASTTRALSSMVGRQLPLFSVLVPAYLVVLLAGFRRTLEVLPAVLAAGLSFAGVQLAASNLVGPELTDILASLASLGALALLLRVWTPAEVWRGGSPTAEPRDERRDPPRRVVRAFAVYAILVLVVLAGQAAASAGLRNVKWEAPWPASYAAVDGRTAPLVHREPPIVAASSPYPLSYRLDVLTSAGTLVLGASAAAFLVMLAFGAPPAAFAVTYAGTLRQLRLPIVTIAFILSIATVMNYSGMTSSMALALAETGFLFPFFSAFIGMLGVFLTGSDTSSNTLFGPLQATTAKVSGLDPILAAATNSSGGVMGKMISPQNLSVGAAGVGAVGREGEIFRRVIGHSLLLTSLTGLLAMLQAYVFPWMIPGR
ncbi:MAG TPA: lactate permease LctP family transporter [Vicinamibacteria bacterium]|nr:lactate permease LctP family transporter [Vicinamibacteria bacterium]